MTKGSFHSDSQAEAGILYMPWASVFTEGDASSASGLGVSPYSELSHTKIYIAGVRTLLEVIKPHKVTGPDEIPHRLVKAYDTDLAPVQSHIYQA